MNDEKYEIVRCPECGLDLTDDTGHILPDVQMNPNVFACTLLLKYPKCGAVKILNMEDYS